MPASHTTLRASLTMSIRGLAQSLAEQRQTGIPLLDGIPASGIRFGLQRDRLSIILTTAGHQQQ
ncbi:hypothetical protein [Marinobacterium arenosum]|uniref:hypothetical protein n=1 Tax=Marinobacterium arenosum TaxID=2862496 RepID=UPI001C95B2CD|nr:hypothetical protein [Marinobacterium arenosum]MBY4679131.1 hypothetical protein [Marinobacterium arenosum]